MASRCHFIVGAGGHGREIREILKASGIPDIVFLDEDREKIGTVVDGSSVLSFVEALKRTVLTASGAQPIVAAADSGTVIAVGSPAAVHRLDRLLREAGANLAVAISPRATVSPRASLDDGVVVFPGAVIGPGVILGRCVTVNVGASVSHDCIVGDYCNINPGARLAGRVTLEGQVYIGMGAQLLPGVSIGHGSVIGAGAVVLADVPPGYVVVGVPAHPVRHILSGVRVDAPPSYQPGGAT